MASGLAKLSAAHRSAEGPGVADQLEVAGGSRRGVPVFEIPQRRKPIDW